MQSRSFIAFPLSHKGPSQKNQDNHSKRTGSNHSTLFKINKRSRYIPHWTSGQIILFALMLQMEWTDIRIVIKLQNNLWQRHKKIILLDVNNNKTCSDLSQRRLLYASNQKH